MADLELIPRGIFALPNEILLRILDLFDLSSLLALTPTCRHLHSLTLRLIHHRLHLASTTLSNNEFYLECHPPSARLTAPKMFCHTFGCPELLTSLLSTPHNDEEHEYLGKVKRAFNIYTRFKPLHHEPAFAQIRYRVPGDIPGSRTYPPSNPTTSALPGDTVKQTVSIDAHDLFSQLSALAFLGKRGPHGLLSSIHEVSQGHIRVWRKWLAEQCERKNWSDGEPITVTREKVDSVVDLLDPRKDASVLWLSMRDENVGIKFRVKERKWRQGGVNGGGAGPVLYASEEEVPVSYVVEFEEILVRTTHLVLKLEESESQDQNPSGKAVIFASIAR